MNQANRKSESSANVKKYSENENDQRSSLPDIPLTKYEKSELEMLQNSQSSESILQELIHPPPKPSKDRKLSAPPIPPKRKTFSVDEMSDVTDNFTMSMRPDLAFARSLNFSDSDDAFEVHQRESSFSSATIEKNMKGSKTIHESESSQIMMSSQIKVFSETDFSLNDFSESRIQTRQDINSQVQTITSNMHDVDNSFSFLTLNQVGERSSNENINWLVPSEAKPPPLPIKTRTRSLRLEQHKSVYDNLYDMNRNSLETKASTTSSNSSLTSSLSIRTEAPSSDYNNHQAIVKNKYMSCIEPGSNFGFDRNDDGENPPPLPLKKKHSEFC